MLYHLQYTYAYTYNYILWFPIHLATYIAVVSYASPITLTPVSHNYAIVSWFPLPIYMVS